MKMGKLLIGVLVAGALLFAAVVPDESEQDAPQITQAEYEFIEAGMTQPAVRSLVGEPESTDLNLHGFGSNADIDCWSYGITSATTAYFCFQNGKLESKNKTEK